MSTTNPLLQQFDQPPFSSIKVEHFKPAIEEAKKKAKAEIDSIAKIEKPNFSNTIEALDQSGFQLERISQVLFNLNSAETNDDIQQLAQEVSPILSDFQNDIMTNKGLFDNVKTVYDSKDNLDLKAEEHTLLDKHYKSFVRNGALLNEEQQKELREIDSQLATLSLKFGQHVLAETNAYQLHVEDQSQLEGLPKQQLEEAEELAKQHDKSGYIFTLQYPSYIPFMKFCKNRALRKELSLAFGKRGFQKNENNNEEIIKSIVSLRDKRAKLLGYSTHAHYTLEERMAKHPDNVVNFLEELLEKARPAAQKELHDIKVFAKETDGLQELQKWDLAYYSEKLKQKKFNLDDNILKPYFSLNQVIDGVFGIANKLFGLQFKQTDKVDVYHKDVLTYEIYDENDAFKATFYADFHPRPGKRGGAWMTSYKSQFRTNDSNERPQISIVCNFSKPGKDTPALLTFNEVTTLFHEFGHALHGILADTTYRSLSGTSVYWDFVELPSQILENWCYEKEALDHFAKHYETGEPIPEKYIEQIKAAANFNEGMQTLRQLSFGFLDMAWHTAQPEQISSVKAFEVEAFKSTTLMDDPEENCMSTAFSHIFQGGYSAGYYSYKWAEVLDADAFEAFKENGIFNTEVAERFKTHILSKGGSEDPMILYKRFRGKEPNPEALLKRAGLLN
jgi:peptidyl-dipeptidase Dcp